jgi:hypothetical protein
MSIIQRITSLGKGKNIYRIRKNTKEAPAMIAVFGVKGGNRNGGNIIRFPCGVLRWICIRSKRYSLTYHRWTYDKILRPMRIVHRNAMRNTIVVI